MKLYRLALILPSLLGAQAPTIFAPGVLSAGANDLTPAFTPDCRTVYFTLANNSESAIVMSRFEHGTWTSPTVAEFSGHWRDLEAAMAPDGSYLVFASNRPVTDSGARLDGNYNGAMQPGRGGNLWRVDRHGEHWGTPVRLPEEINANTSIFSPSVVADGSVYFMKATSDTGHFQLYWSQFAAGHYAPAVQLPFSDDHWTNVDATVAPDQSFAVFASSRPPTAAKDLDLYIVFRQDGAWGTPVSLGPRVNSPSSEIEAHLAPDGHTLYFASNRTVPTPPGAPIDVTQMLRWNNGLMHIWQIDIASWLPIAPTHTGCCCGR